MFRSILVLCIGNICRSPLAQAQLQARLGDTPIQVTSAGLHAMPNHPAQEHSQQIAQAHGLDLSQHKGVQVNQHLLKHADLVLVMTNRQLKQVHQDYPETRGKVFLLCNAPATDIPDPYQQDKSAFEYAWSLIQQGIDQWTKVIKDT